MAERTIWGVDYSGAKEIESRKSTWNTWITEAELRGDELEIKCCRPVLRTTLTEDLKKLPPNAVVAMDFPFGLPKLFLEEEFSFSGTLMYEMWKTISEKDNLPAYIEKIRPKLRKNGKLAKFSKLLRQGDRTHFSEAYSPLNPATPEMFPMTFHGMNMLHTLWSGSNSRVPPLDNNGRTGPELLETMPGVLLRTFCLPAKNYKRKNQSNCEHPEKVRSEILDGLKNQSTVPLEISEDFRKKCEGNDDCLDSLVAAIGAAMWAKDRTLFHCPEDHQDRAVLDSAQLEGWIYAPKRILSTSSPHPRR